MKAAGYFITLLFGLGCVTLSVVLIVVARGNQNLQMRLQRQQEALSSGVLGAQGQQVSGSVLQDMGNAAAGNPAIRELLSKYGYRVQAAQSPAAAAAAESRPIERGAPVAADDAKAATASGEVTP